MKSGSKSALCCYVNLMIVSKGTPEKAAKLPRHAISYQSLYRVPCRTVKLPSAYLGGSKVRSIFRVTEARFHSSKGLCCLEKAYPASSLDSLVLDMIEGHMYVHSILLK